MDNDAKCKFHIVDSIMGSGKSQGAITYINEHPEWKFIVVTPYLTEVKRFINCCTGHHFKEPRSTSGSKTVSLNILLDRGENIVTTHSLFMMQAEEIKSKYTGYHLIIDESPENVITEVENIYETEVDYLFSSCLEMEENGNAKWIGTEGPTRFADVRQLCSEGRLKTYVAEGDGEVSRGIFEVFPVSVFESFEETILLTYLLDGQIFKGYLDICNMKYDFWYVEANNGQFRLTMIPQPFVKMDYKSLIHICDAEKINAVGNGFYALSRSWYEKDDKRSEAVSKNLYNYFHNVTKAKKGKRIWTTFSSKMEAVADKGHYANCFIACNTRATNDYRGCDKLAYLVNRFIMPSYSILFSRNKVMVSNRLFALQEMLQWIWRSAIRDGKPIDLYIPSERMRNLLVEWLDYVAGERDTLFDEPAEVINLALADK